ncbi:cobalamin biosynthesis protein [Rhodococcoides kyotonense]|uniref:Cobalt-precorrin 5A hydrolase n=1 Tax=Rhodococcoides kyotonense TaxID=398843 RepID=A0A239D7Y8_9NOCA|nr:cobalamin biosynthesis protein [Rhodococcus kyotonensis]SNS28440.1 cobalt-precorrin 5A hydrolase [Rhodococcus kyotonensis]
MPERVVAGVGASSSATTERCVDAIRSVVEQGWVLVSIATLESKADALGPVALALGVPLTLWTAEELAQVTVSNPSRRVHQRTGSASVAEAAASLGSGGGRPLVPKTNIGTISVAIACVDD